MINKFHFLNKYLVIVQGEDVCCWYSYSKSISNLKNYIPAVYDQLVNVCEKLENHFRDMQDFKFTIENNKLYMLQTMNDKHTGLSAVRIAVEMVNEGLIYKETAIKRIPADSISSLLVPVRCQVI